MPLADLFFYFLEVYVDAFVAVEFLFRRLLFRILLLPVRGLLSAAVIDGFGELACRVAQAEEYPEYKGQRIKEYGQYGKEE